MYLPVVARCVLAGAMRRCPRCRAGRIYRGYWDMNETCPTCALSFEPQEGEFTGALMAGQGLFGLIAAIGFIVLYQRHASILVEMSWLAGVLILGPILFYPNLKGAWLGFLYGVGARGPGGKPD